MGSARTRAARSPMVRSRGRRVTCPWHGWQFDVRTGKTPLGPRIKQAVYEVKIEGQDVLVGVP